MNNKLVSFLIPTRKRVIFLKGSINSVLKNLDDCSNIELIFRIDSDDADTINCIQSLPFDNLYINGEKKEYDKNLEFNKLVDMHFIISDRGTGYRGIYNYFNDMYKVSNGKWLFLWCDDLQMVSDNWYDELLRLDSIDKLVIAKLSDWNIILMPKEIPDLFGYISHTIYADIFYDDIARELDIYEDTSIEIKHNRTTGGQTTIDREVFFRELEKSPNWVNNHWVGAPPGYDIEEKNICKLKLKEYIESKNMNVTNTQFLEKLDKFFKSLTDENLPKIQQDFKKKIPDTINCNFMNGAFVEILGNSNSEYTVEFIDMDTDIVVFKNIIMPQHWTKTNRQWFTNWKVKVYTTELVYENTYTAKDNRVYVHLSSGSIGDTLAWFPYVEEFRKKHGCKMVCSTFHNNLFKDTYKDIEFVSPGTEVRDLYAMYEIGIHDDDFDRNKNDHKTIPLQKVASDMLGLKFKEVRPNISFPKIKNKIPGKYVVIATESTAQCKLWNNPDGWQKVVDYLNGIGYKVVVVQKGTSGLKNVIERVGNKDLNVAINLINNAEFFIGISSGLSWMAWALKKKVIMISGFTMPWYEFNENCYRINNQHSCKGCWHEHIFDKGDWNWCPLKKNFECSSTIPPEAVFTQIQTIFKEYDMMYTIDSPDTLVNLTNSIIGYELGNENKDDAAVMFFEIFRTRCYDHNKCRVEKDDIVLDLGANIGVFTQYAKANCAKKIYSFEPMKENYDIFLKNNNISSVILYDIGVSDKCGTEEFHMDSTTGGHTMLNSDRESRTKEIRKIECLSLNYMFDNEIIPDKINFMKIDTEGSEVKILDGISDENLLKIDKISMEWHQFLFEDKKLVESIIKRFVNLKYHFYKDFLGSDIIMLYFWK